MRAPETVCRESTVRGSHMSASATTQQPEATRPKQTTLTKEFEKGSLYDRTSKHWKEVN